MTFYSAMFSVNQDKTGVAFGHIRVVTNSAALEILEHTVELDKIQGIAL